MKNSQFSYNALKRLLFNPQNFKKNKLPNEKIQISDSLITNFKGEIDGIC